MRKSLFIAAIALSLSAIPWLCWSSYEAPRMAQLLPSQEVVLKPWPELAYFDDRAFEVAVILEEQGVWGTDVEVLNLAQLIVEKADHIAVPPSLILAVIHVESSFDPCAVSRVGAKGLMQVMPRRILGPERADLDFAFNYHLFFDPHWNIAFGAEYLGEMIDRFGSLEMALTAYNLGPTRLSNRIKKRPFQGSYYARKVLAAQKKYGLGM